MKDETRTTAPAQAETNEIHLHARDIHKRYGGIQALDGVSLEVRKGEVHALVGENGAGKSTLIKVLTGAIAPSSGEIVYEGQAYSCFTPDLAISLGITAIYQEFNLVPSLSVAENIYFGNEIVKNGVFCDKKAMRQKTAELFRDIGMEVDPAKPVKDLGIAQQQMVEIVKAVSKNSRFIIMDEPSAPLTENETQTLHDIVRRLKDRGITIIYISHRLEEVFTICDRVSILRDGQYVGTKNVEDTNRQDLIANMVGSAMGEEYPPRETQPGNVVLEVENITTPILQGVSLQLHQGEILGIGGLMGAGRTELARAIFGADKTTGGRIAILGREIHIRKPSQAMANGIGLLPEDRKGQGAILGMNIRENITLPILKTLVKLGFIDGKKENALCGELVDALSIKTSGLSQPVKNLSGGNQQKVVFAKILATRCDILIIDEPTRGIDVGAKYEIYLLMRELVRQGKSIIMISSEMTELIGMSDRILVMREGRITKELTPGEYSQETILTYASL